ncbi:MAG TPA: hypothetical protein VE690_13985 [Rhodopila sp.]|nr:hypothetical protein [Rhodopila sp.]
MQPIPAPISIPALDRILAFLAPLFLDGPQGNPQAARVAAAEALQAYAARSEEELRLAAQIICFSLRALDALARAADPDLDVKTILRLNSSATSLNQAAIRCRKELDRLRAQPFAQKPSQDSPAEPGAEPPELLAIANAIVHTLDAAASPACASPLRPPRNPAPDAASSPVPKLSRQQRRLAERLAERERRRQPDHARQVERTLLSPRELEAAL